MEELRALYQQEKNLDMQVKVGDEADQLKKKKKKKKNESEANAARRVFFIFHETPCRWVHMFIQLVYLILTPNWLTKMVKVG